MKWKILIYNSKSITKIIMPGDKSITQLLIILTIKRIWLTTKFNLHKSEYPKCEKYIKLDPGNNSAWNYRFLL